MNTNDKIIQALGILLDEAESEVGAHGDDWDLGYAAGVRASLNQVRAISEGVQ